VENDFKIESEHLKIYKNKLSTRLIARGIAQTTTRSPGIIV
jgi:hypothetical protein